jgi:hypothetical protein
MFELPPLQIALVGGVFMTVNVPPMTVVVPVYVLAPASVSSPVPAFTRLPAPEIGPEKVVVPPFPPAVSVKSPRTISPTPAIDPTASDAPSR